MNKSINTPTDQNQTKNHDTISLINAAKHLENIINFKNNDFLIKNIYNFFNISTPNIINKSPQLLEYIDIIKKFELYHNNMEQYEIEDQQLQKKFVELI